MSTHEQTRRAHRIVDALKDSRILSSSDVGFLRSFLPELPKQKTLEEIAWDMDSAWAETSGNDWKAEMFGDLETWLSEQHAQLRAHLEGVKSQAHPALPAGMRIAVHAVYGRVVVSPVVDDDGTCKIFYLSTHARDGSDSCWAPIDSLTFIDAEPAKPAHPEFLETEADYNAAPEGTIVVADGGVPCHKFQSTWSSVAFVAIKDNRGMSRARRRVLRWGK